MSPEHQRRNAYLAPWHEPKVILHAARISRGPWRIAAFADFDGLTCYRTFIAAWPHDPTDTTLLAAVLNGPVANAFVASREGIYNTQGTLEAIPIPRFSPALRQDVNGAVDAYLRAIAASKWDEAKSALLHVDAILLRAYDLPPRTERKLLDYFRGAPRKTPFDFGNYFPVDMEPCFSLADYISDEYAKSTAGEFLRRRHEPPDHVLEAMKSVADAYSKE